MENFRKVVPSLVPPQTRFSQTVSRNFSQCRCDVQKITRRGQWAAQEEMRLRGERQAHLLSLGQGHHALRKGQFFLWGVLFVYLFGHMPPNLSFTWFAINVSKLTNSSVLVGQPVPYRGIGSPKTSPLDVQIANCTSVRVQSTGIVVKEWFFCEILHVCLVWQRRIATHMSQSWWTRTWGGKRQNNPLLTFPPSPSLSLSLSLSMQMRSRNTHTHYTYIHSSVVRHKNIVAGNFLIDSKSNLI